MHCGFSSGTKFLPQMELQFLIPRLTYFSFYPLFFMQEEQVGLLGFRTRPDSIPYPQLALVHGKDRDRPQAYH